MRRCGCPQALAFTASTQAIEVRQRVPMILHESRIHAIHAQHDDLAVRDFGRRRPTARGGQYRAHRHGSHRSCSHVKLHMIPKQKPSGAYELGRRMAAFRENSVPPGCSPNSLRMGLKRRIGSNRSRECAILQLPMVDLNRLRLWIGAAAEVPEGDWYKDFGSFKISGIGPSALTHGKPGGIIPL